MKKEKVVLFLLINLLWVSHNLHNLQTFAQNWKRNPRKLDQ
jgi:hypothetical protein